MGLSWAMITRNMKNKICVVTGATSGIGKETALGLAEKGAHVVIVGRNEKKCIRTVSTIKKISGNSSVEFICSDLSSLMSVRDVAKQLINRGSCLDVLVNNVGGYFIRRQETLDGYEMNFALNYLSPFLLTLLLIDMLKASTQGRVINVSSQAHNRGKIHFDDLQLTHNFMGLEAYAQSKLAIILFTYELSRRLQDTNITVNALHPGLVDTNFGKNNGLIRFYIRRLVKLAERRVTSKEGAQTSIFLASSEALNQCSGGYYINKELTTSSPASNDLSAASNLWYLTKELVGV